MAQGLTIEGVVTDRTTKQPLPGVLIRDSTLNNTSGAYRPTFSAKTDASGRYRISGFPMTGVNRLMAVPPDDAPYFIRDRIVQTPAEPGGRALTLNFELAKGIWLTGKVTDKDSQKPVMAELHYLPFLDNEYAQQLPEILAGAVELDSSRLQGRYRTKSDGSFRVVGLPGRAIVAVGNAMGSYATGIGADQIEGVNDQGRFNTFANPVEASLNNLVLVEINPGPEEKEVKVELQLVRGRQRSIEIVDADGKPVLNTLISGLHSTAGYLPKKHVLPIAQVVGLGPGETRTVLVQQPRRQLTATARVVAAQTGTQRVVLRGGVQVRGRLVDGTGDPVQTRIEALTTLIRNQVKIGEAMSDEAGNFVLTAIPGELTVEFRLTDAKYRLPAGARQKQTQSGVAIDLGSLVITGPQPGTVAEGRGQAVSNGDSSEVSTRYAGGVVPAARRTFSLAGTVADANARPLAKATVRFFLERHVAGVGRRVKAVGKTATNVDGRFSVRIKDDDGFAADSVIAIASQRGHATDWIQHDLDDVPTHTQLRLARQSRPIRGRIVDLEGLPLAGAEVQIQWIGQLDPNADLDQWEQNARRLATKNASLPARQRSRYPSGRLAVTKAISLIDGVVPFVSARVGKDGTFALPGTSKNQVVELRISGPAVESTRVHVLDRDMKPLAAGGIRHYGREFTIPVKPGRMVEGIVVDSATKQPLPALLVRTQGEETTTDPAGRFTLTSQPLHDHTNLRVGPIRSEDSVYFSAAVSVPPSASPASEPLTIELTRGVPVHGRVVDNVTGQPVQGSVTYMPADVSAQRGLLADDGLSVQEQAYHSVRTNPDGTFTIAAREGQGYLAVRAKRQQWYRVGEGAEEDDSRMRSSSYNKRVPIFVDTKRAAEPTTIALSRYPMHQIEVVDPEGRKLTDFRVIGIGPVEVKGHVVQVHESEADDLRHLMVIHADRQLGALVNYRPSSPPKSLSLRRLARIEGRLPNEFSDRGSRVSLLKPAAARAPKFADLPPGAPFMLSVVRAESEGRFAFDVPPGVAYEIEALDDGSELQAREAIHELRPGESRNMGTLDFVPYRTAGGVL